MGDLISRSKLIRGISKVCGDLGIELPDQIIDIITVQPTAYDVEKVVAELEKEFPINPYPNEFTNGRSLAIKKAIDIVKRGGVK